MPIMWRDDPEHFNHLLSELANGLQAALSLSALMRRQTQHAADDAVRLESQIDRATRAVAKLREGGTR